VLGGVLGGSRRTSANGAGASDDDPGAAT